MTARHNWDWLSTPTATEAQPALPPTSDDPAAYCQGGLFPAWHQPLLEENPVESRIIRVGRRTIALPSAQTVTLTDTDGGVWIPNRHDTSLEGASFAVFVLPGPGTYTRDDGTSLLVP